MANVYLGKVTKAFQKNSQQFWCSGEKAITAQLTKILQAAANALSPKVLYVGVTKGSGTLCGFHTYVGADDMWVLCWEAYNVRYDTIR